MMHLDISSDLYAKIQDQARQTGQSIEEWLTDQVRTDQYLELNQLNTWLMRLVAHDLRTPLAAIITSTEILKYYRERLTEERQTEHLNTVQMQVRALNNLLDNVMVVQKYAAGRLNFDPVPQNLEDLCREAMEETSGIVYQNTRFDFRADGTLPAVTYDEKLLLLALTNVLINAVEYSAEGAPVEITLAITDSQAIIRVSDQGLGIPEAEQGQVFDLFFRASNVQSFNGHGLGLAVVQRVIDLHKGSVNIDSAPGRGTTVTIHLPLQ